MVVVCEYSRAERHCCRPSHSYRLVAGYMLIRIRSVLVIEERSLIVGIIVAVNVDVARLLAIGKACEEEIADYCYNGQHADNRWNEIGLFVESFLSHTIINLKNRLQS
jgi:hypothetical protein